MRLLPIFIAISAIVAILLFTHLLTQKNTLCGTGHVATIRTQKQTLQVTVSATQAQQVKGLGGCKKLARKTGMLFPFSVTGPQTFWMKDMLIPLDMVWIKNNKVVGITDNIPFPEPNTPDAKLLLYHSPKDVDAVLEVGAGTAQEYGLTIGSQLVMVN
jgi:uncharacterized membrane protein (UPF0127 family)